MKKIWSIMAKVFWVALLLGCKSEGERIMDLSYEQFIAGSDDTVAGCTITPSDYSGRVFVDLYTLKK